MKKPKSTWKRTITTDERLSAYRIRLVRGFSKALTDLADQSPKLSHLVYDFMFALRTVEVTANLPYHVVSQMKTFVDSYVSARDEPKSLRIARAITGRIAGDLNIADREVRQAIAVKCLEIGAQAERLRVREAPFSVDEIWNRYYADPGFKLALDGSQRLGFVATYNAYEELFCRCIGTALGFTSFRKKSDPKFELHMRTAFGDELCNNAWANSEYQLFRATRHALSHAGGHETQELRESGHPFSVADGVIHVGTHHLRHALGLVQYGAFELVTAALSHPSFRINAKSSPMKS